MAEEKKVSTAAKKPAAKKAPAKKVEAPKEEVKVEAPKKETAKKAPAKKAKPTKEVKKEAPKKVEKPKVTEASASALNVKLTPRKARYIIDSVRGKDVSVALGLLKNTGRNDAASAVSKVIASAVANAVNNFQMNEEKLYIASIQASDGIKMKRYLPRAKGSASGLVKRYSNIYVTVKERN